MLRKLNAGMTGVVILGTFAAHRAAHAQADDLGERNIAVIAEAYHLWQTLGDEIWPGWSETATPMVFITGEHDYAIGFNKPLDAFTSTDQRVADRNVQMRDRQLKPTLAASYYFQGVPAVIIGSPESIGWSPTQWTLKAAHEMFHVHSMRHGRAEKVAKLQIGPKDDPSWQLNFPFPYDDVDVMALMHLQAYPVYLAITADENAESDIRYNASTAMEAREVLRSILRDQTGNDRAANYAVFQEGEEGVARYTEYRLAQRAAGSTYEPLARFAGLEDFTPYAKIWDNEYKASLFVIKHAGRAVKTRTLFYYTGMGKALLLDRLDPDWKDTYLTSDAWLDERIVAALRAGAGD